MEKLEIDDLEAVWTSIQIGGVEPNLAFTTVGAWKAIKEYLAKQDEFQAPKDDWDEFEEWVSDVQEKAERGRRFRRFLRLGPARKKQQPIRPYTRNVRVFKRRT